MTKIGYKVPLEVRQKISKAKLAEKNPHWAGDKVGLGGLHRWVHKRIKKPKICTNCNKRPTLDLANITGIYNRELKNWKWLCRYCHMKIDGRVNILSNYRKGKKPWNKGKAWSKEMRQKISASLIGKYHYKHTLKTRKKMSLIRKKWWEGKRK